jgi:hypothetical protein
LGNLKPAESFNDGQGRLGDVPRELELVDAAQDDVVDLHRIRRGERGARKNNRIYFLDCFFLEDY